MTPKRNDLTIDRVMPELPGIAALDPPEPVDLSARVIYFPVRHHSPACAWHAEQLLREIKPTAVLIEGPRDATPLIPLLVRPETTMPVAIYTTYVRRTKDQPPDRHAAYYPLCDFSPELVAARVGLELNAAVEFIDLSFPEKIVCEAASAADVQPFSQRRSQSLQAEPWFSHSKLLQAACVQTGSRDPDDLWDHLYELDYQQVETVEFMRRVLLYCQLARRESQLEQLMASGCLAREQAMAAAVKRHTGRVVVVTGGFHTVALPHTTGRLPKSLKLAVGDHQVVLMRYSFDQLDRLNGYASGMPSPAFYQRMWERQDAAQLLVRVARRCRQQGLGTSTADAIAAVAHARGLARLREHAVPSREDVLDAVRSLYVKGDIQTDGVPVMAIARKLLAGDRVGSVPPEAGQPPIVHDFRNLAAALKLKLDKVDDTEATLDLYRKQAHRQVSRLFHRLVFLDVPFADFVRGPDFVTGHALERIQEVWRYRWSPATESTLIERSVYGSTVEEAASSRLLEQFQEAQSQGQGRSSALATGLVLAACRMGLHRHTQDLLTRVGSLIAEDAAFDSLVAALEDLLVLQVAREPLEAHHLSGLSELARQAYLRACFVLPSLVSTSEEEEPNILAAMNALVQGARTLGDTPELQDIRSESLTVLAATSGGSAAARGGAVGLLHGDGRMRDDLLVQHLRGHLLSSRQEGLDGPSFLRGLLNSARSVLWQVPGVLAAIDEVVQSWDEQRFVRLLPVLRLALSNLTPRETDTVARQIAALLGTESLSLTHLPNLAAEEMLRAVEVNRQLRATLDADGLEMLGE